LVEQGELDVSPMDRVRQPKTTQKLVPIMGTATGFDRIGDREPLILSRG
jgi:hypothetical protein